MEPSVKIEEDWAHAEGTTVTRQQIVKRVSRAGKLPNGQVLDVALPEGEKMSPAEYRRRTKEARRRAKELRKAGIAQKKV